MYGVWGVWFEGWGVGCGVWGVGCEMWGAEGWVWGVGFDPPSLRAAEAPSVRPPESCFRVEGSRLRVWGAGTGVRGYEFEFRVD